MEAGYGALTQNCSPCPVRGCAPLASLVATRVQKDQRGSGRKGIAERCTR